jgi:alpha-L-fucosidase
MVESGKFQGNSISKLGKKDIRFTRNKTKSVVYAIALGWSTEPFVVQALGSSAATSPGRIANVELIGSGAKLRWNQSAEGLRVELPREYTPAADYAAALKVTLAGF